ncbi:putative Tubulin folding cofactor C [Melia azedarach]|uniref:Tubulin folding cofactor C n=1 Tax=Melia azedarach TaxID=155640 RepID=A0ACC1XR14_MELAZ|nr:putative Tubulin folding cofactor C [Melia azedarach]
MLERLAARHETLLETGKSDSPDSSSTSAFFSRFNDLKKSITSQIESAADPSRLPDVSSSISDLENLVAENSYALPSYEVRSSLKTISGLNQNFDNLSANFPVRDWPGLRDKENQVLVKNSQGTEIGEFTITGLDSCEAKLIGCVNALFIDRLKNCKVYAGPVMGSILIEEEENCVLVLASHQIRIHFAKRSDFYLRVRSRPIIEDSNEVRFAPYCLKYERIEKVLGSSRFE